MNTQVVTVAAYLLAAGSATVAVTCGRMCRSIAVLLMAVLSGACRAQEPPSPAPSAPARVVSAPADNYLLQITQAWGSGSALGDLRTRPLPPDGVEVRLWGGYGLVGTRGLILRRTHGRWEAWRATVRSCWAVVPFGVELTPEVRERYQREAKERCSRRALWSGQVVQVDTLEIRVLRARSDLDAAWTRAVAAGLLQLPPKVARDWTMLDGHTYVLEVRQGDEYRASVIEHVEEPEADADRAIQQISGILWEPFARDVPP